MASLLAVMGYEVTLLFDYDSSVRGGMSEAFLSTTANRSTTSWSNVRTSSFAWPTVARFTSARTTSSPTCDLTKPGETGEEIPFLQLGVDKFGRDLFGNMIALGRLLCVCDVDFTDEHLTEALPKKYIEENIAAIKYGYGLDAGSIKADRPRAGGQQLRRALRRERPCGHRRPPRPSNRPRR